ncbi:MAG: chromate resistance protein [Candidatus Binataceae bacterium]|nr:chromate resistance protein [Candidatus Binataceae bacterium]MBF6571747.1 chromate resistance protein [Candidatus Binataceae bacterium]
MAESNEKPWLLLIHNLPPKPDYFRVKIWRRLQRIGAVAIKNSVYVMPRSDQALEDLQWTLREITEGHGEASICEADFVDGLSDDQVEALFKAARDADYAAIAAESREFVRAARSGSERAREKNGELEPAVARLRRRLGEVVAIDFFDSLGRQTAEGLVASLEASLHDEPPIEEGKASLPVREYCKRIWVTRKGLHIDRMASAWLVRRFIDADAVFKFVPARGYRPEEDELRFDMFQAEFTHEGDRCTFEVLIDRMKLRDAALHAIGEIIHDIDLKDAKFDRQEAAGIDRVITGICRAYKDDEARLARGAALFDDLYASFVRKGR